MSKAIDALILELSAGAAFYTDNDEFLGDGTLERDPIYSLQGHLIYGFRSGIWFGLDATYYTGGRTTVDGLRSDDRQENARLGLTASLPAGRHHSVKLYASSGVATRVGSNFDTVGAAWQYRWGGGL